MSPNIPWIRKFCVRLRKEPGQVFEAKDKESLRTIYEIDQLERTDIELEVNALYEDLYQWPLMCMVLIIVAFLLEHTLYQKTPANIFVDQLFLYLGAVLLVLMSFLFSEEKKKKKKTLLLTSSKLLPALFLISHQLGTQ